MTTQKKSTPNHGALKTQSTIKPSAMHTQVVCVTGSAKRIGAAIVKHMHALGYRVIIHCHTSVQQAQALAATLNAKRSNSAAVVQANLDDVADFARLAERIRTCFGRLDVLVHNASRFYPTDFATTQVAQWHELFNSNAKAPYFLTQALYNDLKHTQGSVVSLLDIHCQDRPFKGYGVYNMAKAAHHMLVKSLSLELAPEVRVNGVAPGANVWPDTCSDQAIAPQAVQRIEQSIPLERVGTPHDIALAVAYLTTASYVTGHVLNVDGGRSLTLAGG